MGLVPFHSGAARVWDDAAEGIDEGIEGPEGFRDSDDDDEGRGGDGGATRRRSEIANGPSREGDGGARGGNGNATNDANRGMGDDGDGEGDSDVEVDSTVSRAPPKRSRTAMEVTEWRANGTTRKGRARRMEKEVPRRPWWRGGTGGRKKGEEDGRPAQAASRQRLLATSRHSPRTLATCGEVYLTLPYLRSFLPRLFTLPRHISRCRRELFGPE